MDSGFAEELLRRTWLEEEREEGGLGLEVGFFWQRWELAAAPAGNMLLAYRCRRCRSRWRAAAFFSIRRDSSYLTLLLLSLPRVQRFVEESKEELPVKTSAAASLVDGDRATHGDTLKPLSDKHPSWPDGPWRTVKAGQTLIPTFTVATITEYFAAWKVSSDFRAAADFSSISDKAYRLFKKGYIQRIEVCCCERTPTLCFLRCKAHPEMKDKLYSIELVTETTEGDVKAVVFAKCGCPAGKPLHGS